MVKLIMTVMKIAQREVGIEKQLSSTNKRQGTRMDRRMVSDAWRISNFSSETSAALVPIKLPPSSSRFAPPQKKKLSHHLHLPLSIFYLEFSTLIRFHFVGRLGSPFA
jgi:hypothetical protein